MELVRARDPPHVGVGQADVGHVTLLALAPRRLGHDHGVGAAVDDTGDLVAEEPPDLREGLWDRFTASKSETLWYYRSLVESFRHAGGGRLVDELDLVVTELERMAKGLSRG